MIFRAAALKVNSPECEGVEQFVWERERAIAYPSNTIFNIAELIDAIFFLDLTICGACLIFN